MATPHQLQLAATEVLRKWDNQMLNVGTLDTLIDDIWIALEATEAEIQVETDPSNQHAPSKSDEVAKRWREQGNEEFKKTKATRNLRTALSLYTRVGRICPLLLAGWLADMNGFIGIDPRGLGNKRGAGARIRQ